MEVYSYIEPEYFRKDTGPFLVRNEAENNLMIGLADQLTPDDEYILIRVSENNEICGCALMTPPHNIVITRMSDPGLEALIGYLRQFHIPVPGVTGPGETAERFCRIWCTSRDGYRLAMEQGIYQCSRVISPSLPPGRFRNALPEDIELLVPWGRAFQAEADPGRVSKIDVRERITGRIEAQVLFVWDDGGPVSMAVAVGPTPHGIRIGYVFTPPEKRRRGYAAACVASLTARMLAEGRKFCFLYTDMANTTSNGIYRRIGYELVCGSRMYTFAT